MKTFIDFSFNVESFFEYRQIYIKLQFPSFLTGWYLAQVYVLYKPTKINSVKCTKYKENVQVEDADF